VIATSFTNLAGLSTPIQLAAMPGISTPELVADTCLTEAFSTMWPGAPHRVLRSAIAAAEALTEDATLTTTGQIDAMALYAGESVGDVTSEQPAAEIVAELIAGAERLLREASG
jgi:NAD(P)H-dependent flavin oxidoreductase YrpB (nitropropane dioxygenase family)